MLGDTWLGYFESNVRKDRAPGDALRREIPEPLRAPLIASLGRFQLGESAGGRIHGEIQAHPDPALDPGTRRSVQLYIEEEWRHARELSMMLAALGGSTQSAHWTNGAFTACRRLLGLRTKMLTLAIAEVVGIVYYRALARGVNSSALAESLCRIANEESRHLDFQAAFFEHAVNLKPASVRAIYRRGLRALMFGILLAALIVLLLDHGRLLGLIRVSKGRIVRDSFCELSTRVFLAPHSTRPLRSAGLAHHPPSRAEFPGRLA